MKKIFIIIFIFFTYFTHSAEYCTEDYNCSVKKNRENPRQENLECTLPNMPTFPITAENVFNSNGSLHEYFGFGAKNVCDVLGWMNNSVSHLDNFEGLKNDITTPLSLKFKHLYKSTGGTTIKTAISLDSDTYKVNTDNENNKLPDGNRHMYRMKYITVHEFLHFISYNSVRKGDFWVAEGTARAFEDMVYDSENSYSDEEAYAPMYGERYIANILEDLKNGDYKTFAFFKLLKDKCTLDMSNLLLENVNIKGIADNCSGLPNIGGDKLASLFLYYNWAMLLQHNFSLIDGNEPVFPKKFQGVLLRVNQKDFENTLDMKNKVDGSTNAYGAKSFIVNADVISKSNKEGKLTLSIKTDNPLTVVGIRLDENGNSTETGAENNFNFTTQAGVLKEYNLTDEDREGGLFITLLNATGEKIKIMDINLTVMDFRVIKKEDWNLLTEIEEERIIEGLEDYSIDSKTLLIDVEETDEELSQSDCRERYIHFYSDDYIGLDINSTLLTIPHLFSLKDSILPNYYYNTNTNSYLSPELNITITDAGDENDINGKKVQIGYGIRRNNLILKIQGLDYCENDSTLQLSDASEALFEGDIPKRFRDEDDMGNYIDSVRIRNGESGVTYDMVMQNDGRWEGMVYYRLGVVSPLTIEGYNQSNPNDVIKVNYFNVLK
jgi:hypothetical protein